MSRTMAVVERQTFPTTYRSLIVDRAIDRNDIEKCPGQRYSLKSRFREVIEQYRQQERKSKRRERGIRPIRLFDLEEGR